MWIFPPVPVERILPLAAAIMIFESGHFVAPIIIMWSRPGLRQVILREWRQLIAAPIGAAVACFTLPYQLVLGLYYPLHVWHFGMQYYGVSCLYRPCRDADARVRRALICLAPMLAAYAVLPLTGYGWRANLFMYGAISFNHWLTDIGLSSQVSGRRWRFIALVLMVGVAWLVLRNTQLSVHRFAEIGRVVSAVGIWHFSCSRWLWKLSDPRVRAAIGGELRI